MSVTNKNSNPLMRGSPSGDSKYEIFGKTVTSAEIVLVAAYPAQSVIAFNASKEASLIIGGFYNEGGWLDNADALRHAYWNALMERRISKNVDLNTGTPEYPNYITVQVNFAKEFADAHEYGNSGIDSEMDLRNNAIGRSDGATFRNFNDDQLAKKIVERISYGNYWQIVNKVVENNMLVSGDLGPSDWVGLKPEIFDEVMFDTTLIGSSEIRIDKVNWAIQGSYTIPTTIKGKTITQIGSSAFTEQIGITSITLPSTVTTIGGKAFKGCSSLTSITIPSGLTTIGNGAFAGCNNLNITVSSSNPNYMAEGNILYNKAKTKIVATGKVASNVTIPSTVIEIAPYAFEGNSNLTTLKINNTPTIGMYSFANCENLTSVYSYSYVVPMMESYAFLGNDFTLYVPHSKQSVYSTAFAGYTNSIGSIAVDITFNKDGVVINTLNTQFGATIAGLLYPFKNGHDFGGWYDNPSFTGTAYANGGLWDTTEDMTVYAKWIPKNYYITFSGYGSNNLAEKLVTYNAPIGALPIISRDGYTFSGWKDQYGEYYTSNTTWGKLNNTTVTSDLRANNYTITFDGNGGTPSALNQTVEYDSVINGLATSTRAGHTFTGWNTSSDGSGQTMSTPFTYTESDNKTLYAQYSKNQYTVTFDKQNGTSGSDGVNATYELPMPSATAPTKTGCTFQGYYSQPNGVGIKYYGSNMTSTNTWNIADPTTIYANWSGNQYTVKLDQCAPGFEKNITSTSSTNIIYLDFTPITSGTIILWTSHTNGDPYLILYNTSLTQLASNDDGYGNLDSKITYNVSSGVRYFVGFRALGSTATNGKVYYSGVSLSPPVVTINATYGSPMETANLTVPTREGYAFQGYFAQPNGGGTKYYNSNMTSANNWNVSSASTIYAYWTEQQYVVVLDKQSGTGGSDKADTIQYIFHLCHHQ